MATPVRSIEVEIPAVNITLSLEPQPCFYSVLNIVDCLFDFDTGYPDCR